MKNIFFLILALLLNPITIYYMLRTISVRAILSRMRMTLYME